MKIYINEYTNEVLRYCLGRNKLLEQSKEVKTEVVFDEETKQLKKIEYFEVEGLCIHPMFYIKNDDYDFKKKLDEVFEGAFIQTYGCKGIWKLYILSFYNC